MNFIKENSYIIFKMFVNQLGMSIFGIALSFATSNYDTFFLASSVFAVIFYMVLLYTMTWEEGFKQSQQIEKGSKNYNPLSGLYMSLCANIINFILGITVIVGFYSSTNFIDGMPSNPVWTVNCFGLGKTVSTLLNGMYAGIINFFEFNPFAYLLIIIPSLFVCSVSYIMGVKGKHLTGLVGNKPNLE